MKDLIRALTILMHYVENDNSQWPLNTSHDTLWIMDVNPADVSEADKAELEALSFSVEDGAFMSHRFGSA
jgi:hypothetical protein